MPGQLVHPSDPITTGFATPVPAPYPGTSQPSLADIEITVKARIIATLHPLRNDLAAIRRVLQWAKRECGLE